MSRTDPYQRTAKLYERFFEPMNAGLRGLSMKLVPPAPGMAVLDIGCGTGAVLSQYHAVGCRVFGVDVSPAMLAVAREKLGADAGLLLCDARQAAFPAATFDLITAMLSLHEMPPSVRDGVLTEVRRILKPDGRLLLVDFHVGPFAFPRGWINKAVVITSEILAGREHFKNYRHFMRHNGLSPLVEKHGFTVETQRIVAGGNFALLVLRVSH